MANRSRVRWILAVAICAVFAVSTSATGTTRCDRLLGQLAKQIVNAADTLCFESPDLTTTNPNTTPADNSLPGLPAFAFTPTTDRSVISPDPPNRTPITKKVPGVQLDARIAGSSGVRSEFNGDFAWSDFVLQKGYAYVSQNKGILNLFVAAVSPTPPVSDPLACRLNPTSTVWVHFYANDPATPFTRWTQYMNQAARMGAQALRAHYGGPPARTYAVGTSNGGYQVRRALETAPELFDGGVDWEGTYVDPVASNILSSLPPAILNFPDYAASGFDPNSTAATNIVLTGYPPDRVDAGNSLWARYSDQFWEVTLCQWQKRLDPTYDTYTSGTGTYSYVARLSASNVGANVAAIATTGDIGKPLVTVAGTMDSLLPINLQARGYARAVAAAISQQDDDGKDGQHYRPAYRLYEVQNGNHIETYKDTPPAFPELELIQPHAQRAFELLTDYVERGSSLPPDQCIPRGGSIAATPTEPGHCQQLFVP